MAFEWVGVIALLTVLGLIWNSGWGDERARGHREGLHAGNQG